MDPQKAAKLSVFDELIVCTCSMFQSVFVFEKGDTVDTADGALHSVWFFERLPRCNEFNCISAIEPLQLLQQHCRDKADHFHSDPIF